jgi:hypothetical protein
MMKNLCYAAVACLFVITSCQKSNNDLPDNTTTTPEHLRATSPTTCEYEADALLRNFAVANMPDVSSNARPVKPPKGGGQGNPTTTTPTTSTYTSCIYIDFDGQNVNSTNWNNGQTINCAPAELTADQKQQVVNEVAALYAAYKVTVTDNESVFNSANSARRIRIIVTPTSYWYGGVSGISYLSSFSWGTDVPAFVFSDRLYNGPHYIAEIVAHEAGHTLGLRHQSEYNPDCSLSLTYKMGVVMGNSLYVPQGAWITGTTYTCNTFQNDHQVLGNLLGLAP